MAIKAIPMNHPMPLADLVAAGEHTVTSRSLARQSPADLTLFAFAAGESVSEEEYPQDTAYICLEGTLTVGLPEGPVDVSANRALKVCAHVAHSVSGKDGSAVKYLQINA